MTVRQELEALAVRVETLERRIAEIESHQPQTPGYVAARETAPQSFEDQVTRMRLAGA